MMDRVSDEFLENWACSLDDESDYKNVNMTESGVRKLESMAQELLSARKVIEKADALLLSGFEEGATRGLIHALSAHNAAFPEDE